MKKIFLINFIFLLILEIIFITLTNLSLSYISVLGLLGISITFTTIMQMVKWNFRVIIHFIFMFIFTITYFANIINLSLKQTILLKDDLVLAGELAEMFNNIMEMLNIKMLSIFIIPFIYIIIIIKYGERSTIRNYKNQFKLLYAVITSIIVISVSVDSTLYLAVHVPNKFVEQFGLQSFYLREFLSFTKINIGDNDVTINQKVVGSDDNNFLEGKKDVVFIIAESISKESINPKITPTFQMMVDDGMYFNNYYNINLNTALNEYSILTGLLSPLGFGSVFKYQEEFISLPEVFENSGYCTYAAHSNKSSYYDRDFSYPNIYKFQNFIFSEDMEIGELGLDELPADTLLFNEAINSVEDGNCEKNFIYMMSYYTHIPYMLHMREKEFYSSKYSYVESLYPNYDEYLTTYLASTIDFDQMLKNVLTHYENNGRLDELVIVIVSDHYPYTLDAKVEGSHLLNYESPTYESFYSDGINAKYNIPFLIYDPSTKLENNNTYISNTDILPTLVDAFGFDDKLLATTHGTSAFKQLEERYVMWYGHNGFSIMSDDIKYQDSTTVIKVGDDSIIESLIEYQSKFLLEYYRHFDK